MKRLLSAAVCLLAACGPLKERLTLQATRIAQRDVDNGLFSTEQLFDIGGFLFRHTFTPEEGLGNALHGGVAGTDPRPNRRRLHHGRFGGPDGLNCQQCHTVGGPNGAGRREDNLLQDGDGEQEFTALVRNPPALLGVGYLQALAAEMTRELRSQVPGFPESAATFQTHPLCPSLPTAVLRLPLMAKGVTFGEVRVFCDKTVKALPQGVDKDLVVKPLGWKGRTASVRRFVEGGFQVHFGMAPETLVARHCDNGIPGTVGDGRDCQDPDDDGVPREITEGQLTAMSIWNLLLPVPVQKFPQDAEALASARRGEHLFAAVSCAQCHVPTLMLDSPRILEAPDLTPGPPRALDLTRDGKEPRLAADAQGRVAVPLFSDLKRHDMGDALADPHATFGTITARDFLTKPLWGVAVTPPYLHDGRADSLTDAIVAHDGEARESAERFARLSTAEREDLLNFLATLGREPGDDPSYALPLP